MTAEVDVYAVGIVHASVCAPLTMLPDEIVAEVNRTHHPGTRRGWRISEDPEFANGMSNPCPCNVNKTTRVHYLLNC